MRTVVEKVVILCGFLLMASLEAFFHVSHAVLRLVSSQLRIQSAVVAFRVLLTTEHVSIQASHQERHYHWLSKLPIKVLILNMIS